ncbi:MAG: conjugative transfer ATPase, partial [Pseudomonas sp.]|nr:conjugative transfer ATPase [Pseudomonas sp.]
SPLSFDPLSRLDRAMNGHLLLFGPTGAGKSATLVTLLMQVMAVYRPRLYIVEAGNSFGLQGDYFATQGLSVNKVQLKPGASVSLAPFADAWRLVEQPDQVASLSIDELDDEAVASREDQRDVLGELEITARLMITGGEAKEEARLSRADRSLIRECILDAAQTCVAAGRQVLTRDVRDALLHVAADTHLPEKRRERAQEMGESIDLFCQGFEGELFDREGTPWPESDVTIVDLATYAREGYEAQMSISYISLMNTVNNLAERDQYLGRPIVMVTDEGHIITKNPLLAPFVVKGTKMWRKLGAWFWLATQNLADFPTAAQTMLNMIEWWICLNMPPAEIEEIARFKKLTPAQKALLLSASKEPGKYTEGVVLSKKLETLFRAVPPSLYLALAMTEPEEKAERWTLMQENGCSELEAAYRVAELIDRARGIELA